MPEEPGSNPSRGNICLCYIDVHIGNLQFHCGCEKLTSVNLFTGVGTLEESKTTLPQRGTMQQRVRYGLTLGRVLLVPVRQTGKIESQQRQYLSLLHLNQINFQCKYKMMTLFKSKTTGNLLLLFSKCCLTVETLIKKPCWPLQQYFLLKLIC